MLGRSRSAPAQHGVSCGPDRALRPAVRTWGTLLRRDVRELDLDDASLDADTCDRAHVGSCALPPRLGEAVPDLRVVVGVAHAYTTLMRPWSESRL